MAILTWQNVPVPDIGRSLQDGTRTAADLLSRAVNHATAGVGQIQGLQEAQRTAETQAADRFALEKMLSAQTPEQLQALQADRFGPAGDRMSPEMLLRVDARGDVLRTRGLQERREAQAPEYAASLAEAIRTGNPESADRLLRSNPDAAAVGPQFQLLDSILTNKDKVKAQLARSSRGKDPIREAWVQHQVGEVVRRMQIDPKLGEERLNQFTGRDFADITTGVQKLTPRQIDDGSFHLPTGASGGSGGSGGGGAKTGAPQNTVPSVSDKITSAMSEGREIFLKQHPELQTAEVEKKFAGMTPAEIAEAVAGKMKGVEPEVMNRFFTMLKEKRPNLTDAQVAAGLSQSNVAFNEENPLEWLANFTMGFQNQIDRPWRQGNLDFNESKTIDLLDKVFGDGSKGVRDEFRQMLNAEDQYKKDVAEYNRISKEMKLAQARGIDASSLLKDQQPLFDRLKKARDRWGKGIYGESISSLTAEMAGQAGAEPGNPPLTPEALNYAPVPSKTSFNLDDPTNSAKGMTLPDTMPEGLYPPPEDALKRKLKTPPSEYVPMVEAAAKKYNLPVELLYGQIATESAWDPQNESPKKARGLMQIIPSTAKMLGVKDVNDPAQSIEGGAKYMRQLLDQFDGDVVKALAAYNAGPDAVIKARGKNGVPVNGETEAYVPAVLARAYRYREMLANREVANR